jgi:hypothetical protein
MTHREDNGSIDDRERYVGYATHCLQLAKATTDLESRAMLREMAAEWLKLVEAPMTNRNRPLWQRFARERYFSHRGI